MSKWNVCEKCDLLNQYEGECPIFLEEDCKVISDLEKENERLRAQILKLERECEELKDIRAQLLEDKDQMKNTRNCQNYNLEKSDCLRGNCPCDDWKLK